MHNIDSIIFDLGGVLIDWNPRYVFHDDYFDSTETRDHFLEQVCNMEWNEQQDAGYPIARATAEKIAQFPGWEKEIREYYSRWVEMLKGPIPETVELFRQLKDRGSYKFYALTNWSDELFPIALDRYDFLHWFDGRVVSGEEKIRKPFPEIYIRLLNRYDVNPGNALFIDDNLRNVKAAEDLGIKSIWFQSPEQLSDVLTQLGLIK